MPDLRVVTGTILRSNGKGWGGAITRFTPLENAYLVSPPETYPVNTVEGVSDSTGTFTVELEAGLSTAYTVETPDEYTFPIIVTPGSPTTLEVLRAATVGALTPAVSLESTLLELLAQPPLQVGSNTANPAQISLNSAANSIAELLFEAAGANMWALGRDILAGLNHQFYIYNVNTAVYSLIIDRATDLVRLGGGLRSSSPSSGIGYTTGAGGAVTQATSKATGVTLNTVTGQITMNAAALAATTTVLFTLTNSTIAATDLIRLHRKSGGTAGAYNAWVDSIAAGSCVIALRNITAGSLSEAVVLQFGVFKGVNA